MVALGVPSFSFACLVPFIVGAFFILPPARAYLLLYALYAMGLCDLETMSLGSGLFFEDCCKIGLK